MNGEKRLALACLVLVSVVLLALAVTTPPIAVNDGEGFDGHEYALMVQFFRHGVPVRIHEPWVYRIGPPWLAALSGLDVKVAFLGLNVAASLGSALLLMWLLRRYGATPGLALLGVFWWATLAPGLRFNPVYYPVVFDGIGFFLLMALVTTALTRRLMLFAGVLAAAALTRENLVVLVPFLWFCLRDQGIARATLSTVLASLPGIGLVAMVRVFPVLPPSVPFESLDVIREGLHGIATNRYYQTWRFLFAPLFAFGALAAVGLWRVGRLRDLVAREPAWAYFLAASVLVTFVGALDPDRRVYLAAPLVLLVAFVPGGRAVWSPRWRVVALTVVQVLASRMLWPIGTDEASYREFSLVTMHPRHLALVGLYEAALFGLALVILWLPPGLWRGSRAPTHPARSSAP